MIVEAWYCGAHGAHEAHQQCPGCVDGTKTQRKPYCGKHNKTYNAPIGLCNECAVEITSTQLREMYAEPKPPAIASPEWNKANITRLNDMVSRELGTPYTVSVERDMCTRLYDITVRCTTCAMWWYGNVSDSYLEMYKDATKAIDERITATAEAVKMSRDVTANACRCVDGLTQKQCLELYTYNQNWSDVKGAVTYRLTDRQLAAARTAWSQELKRKVKDSERKERAQVVVDVQDEE